MAFRIGTVGMVTAALVSCLACYTLSLRVSAERSQVESLQRKIAGQMKDVRALEAELKTRARLPQLQRWNDDVLALSAPTAKQYADNPVQLASFAPGAPAKVAPTPAIVRQVVQPAPAMVHTAAYVVPAPVVSPEAPRQQAPAAVEESAKPKAKPVQVAKAEAPKPKAAKAEPDKKSLDSLFDDIDRTLAAESPAKLVKVSLR